MSFKVAVLGDVHAFDPARPRREEPRSPDERAEQGRRGRARREAWHAVLDEVRAACPDLLFQTGDLVNGDARDEADMRAEAEAALADLWALGVPTWLATGNHDLEESAASRRVWAGVQRAHLARQLGGEPDGNWYAVLAPGARFLVLDYRDTSAEQMTWVRRQAEAAAKERGERLFLVSHAPLYSVARPFFSNPVFTRSLFDALGDAAVDAYFCGHTHNQCVSFVKRPSATAPRLLQAKSAVVGSKDRSPLPLLHVRSPLQEGAPEVLWGYLEDTAPGWLELDLHDDSASLTWRPLGQGAGESVRWRNAGVVEALHAPSVLAAGLGAEDARRITAARVFLAFWGSNDPEKEVRLNGVPIGYAPVADWYLPRSFVPVPPEALGAVRRMNEIAVANPRGEPFALGAAYLEVTLEDGRTVRSTPSDFVVTVGDGWSGWDEPTLMRIPPGEPAVLRALRFRPV